MTPEQIDKELAAGQAALIQCFTQHLQEKGLEHLLPYSHPYFTVDSRLGRFDYRVEVLFQPAPHDTSDGMIIINDSYQGKSLFQASRAFALESETLVKEAPAPEDWRNYHLEKELVLNPYWKEMFHL